MSDINNSFGKGIVTRLGSAGGAIVATFPSGCLTLYNALGGGLPKGRIVEINGPESSGKTTLALHAIASLQEHALGLHRRFPSKGVSTPVLDHKGLGTKRRPAIFASGVEEEGPSLNINKVELLLVAVHTLLRPENQKRLRERLEKNKQPTHGEQPKVLEQPTNGDKWSSPAFINSLEHLEEVRYVEVEGDGTDSGRSSSDQVSLISTSVTIPRTSQTTKLAESEGESQSIETMESFPGHVEGKRDSSLTSI